MGYIYILTNPSFKEYVKIGYATDIKQRLDELNSSTAVPYSFRVYATYEVDSNLSDKKLHTILDTLAPELRSIEECDGKIRRREFYAMSPKDAYSILESIAQINNYEDRLKLWTCTPTERTNEIIADEIREEHKQRLSSFKFSMCNIHPDEYIELCLPGTEFDGAQCKVVDDKHIEYNSTIWSLSSLVSVLTDGKSKAGPLYYKYNGEWLNDIRKRLETNDSI